ncbi:high nitrogen upregulated cytochrome P450 monooxygenase 2 [Dichomitus squalens LYAD-421 SS1]|uniref:High nitrogen upregulated cytochrome P450 monooxygenase 2 n=1 Tax=Dichomitus squalens (strain LYAD-421) TaxID=732165 RepID=R7SJS8_DICSQ|nr:high nitrogen upregulated cytochrome P450 monooxygenase 2 [Dichomitus squalens LYAD-421 SS1]EJF55985.1 high nitrogen upregulated cytochrome P450 monooxygenase 2 [Dichomitus squalens LYAD-421 SS1]
MPAGSSPSQVIGKVIALGLIAHQVFRKYETYDIAVHGAFLFLPPALLSLFSSPPQWTLLHALLFNSATYLTTLVMSVIVYRLSPVHPLARYPGPIGCKVSKFWMAFLSMPGYQHQYIKSLHERYGDVVRIGPNEVSVRDATALHALLGPSGAPKGPHLVGRVLSEHTLPMVGIMDTDVHLRRRKNWGRGMSPAAIKDYEQFIALRARQLLERLEGRMGEEVVIGTWFNFFTYDFMSDMAFGGGTELIKAGHDEGNVWALLDEAMFISTFLGHVPWLGVHFGKIPAATGNLNILLNNCAECVKARLKRGSQRKDLFHYLNNEDLTDKAAPPMQQLIDDGVLAIVAGADTTSSALTGLMYLLLTHPDAYQKLQAEIDKFYPAGENALDTKHHRDMPYLTAVINETLRVLPPVPGGSQRQVPVGGNGLVAGNIVLPPGTIFWPHIYSHHHDARNFSPYTSDFWPERWLLASGDLDSSRGVTASSPEFRHNEAGYLPFSIGPMNCVGKALALQELRMVVCAFLQKFKVRTKEGWDPRTYEREYRDYFTSPRPDLPVRLEVRS